MIQYLECTQYSGHEASCIIFSSLLEIAYTITYPNTLIESKTSFGSTMHPLTAIFYLKEKDTGAKQNYFLVFLLIFELY